MNRAANLRVAPRRSNDTQATLIDNLIVRNSAASAAACSGTARLAETSGSTTRSDNEATYYPGLYIFGYTFNDLYNNIITAASGPAVFCEYTQVPGSRT